MNPGGEMASVIRHRIAALIALVGLLASAACSPPPVPPGPERLRLSTAPSVAPLAQKLAKQYQGRHSNVTVETDETGAEAALEWSDRPDPGQYLTQS